MRKNFFLYSISSFAALGALLLSSCAPITPQTRIQKNLKIYDNLPESDKSLVRQGRIKKGMHKDGVFLAWGKARAVTQGSKNGKNFERWIYTASTPVYHHGISPFFNYNWGGRGWGHGHRWSRGGFYGIGMNPGVTYAQSKRASVNFNQHNKVDSWESRR